MLAAALNDRVLRVAIADDDSLCRQKTKSFLAKEHDVNIVAECTEVQELIDALRERRPDVLDTALMLTCRRALWPLLDDAAAAARAAARLADEHRGTPMTGRTLLQQAMPVTFGLRAAGWLVGLDESALRVAALTMP